MKPEGRVVLALEKFLGNGDPEPVLAARTTEVESAVGAAFREFLTPNFPEGIAIVAVGGFGRRELFPHSDVDLVLLFRKEPRTGPGAAAVAEFVRALWDAGLRLGHSVRTVSECCSVQEGNLELSISLLDQRFLAGDGGLYAELCDRLPRFFYQRRHELMNYLCRLARVRHARYANTFHHLEPNVKETPGGLRDLQLVRWLSQLRGAQPYRLPSAGNFPDLLPAQRLLHQIRCFLHFKAGRDNNLLAYELQEEFASLPFVKEQDPSEWVREYYRQARLVYRAARHWLESSESPTGGLLLQFQDWRSRLSNADFTVTEGRVFLKQPGLLTQDPRYVQNLFLFVARHGLPLAPETRKRVLDALPHLQVLLGQGAGLWGFFKELLELPHAALGLQEMDQCRLLPVWLPEWELIDCLVVRDFYHRFTVDAHALATVQALEDLRQTSDPLLARFRQLLEEVESPAVLFTAALLHDLGKGTRSGNHVPDSVRLARQALERWGAPAQETEAICFLIERHMDFPAVVGLRDLEDPGLIDWLAERCSTEERLRELVLLAYGDLCAVNPAAASAWRLEQLWQAYAATYNRLVRQLEAEKIQSARASLDPELAEFLDGFPARYFKAHTLEEIRGHRELCDLARQKGLALELTKLEGRYRLTVATADRPYLLASIAGTLAGFGLNILKAEAFSNSQGMVLDCFFFEDPNRTLELNPGEDERLLRSLERVLAGRLEVTKLLAGRKAPSIRRKLHIKPIVSISSQESAQATLVEIVAADRPGLLYELAKAIAESGCNIEILLANTQAHKAIDVFYVTSGGRKLDSEQAAGLRQKLLDVCRTQS